MKEIKIGFSCLPVNFQKENNFIYNALSKKYKLVLSDNPEYLFYSSFAGDKPKARVKVFFTGENRRPNMEECDWAFGFDLENTINHERYMRLPLYVLKAAGMRNFWYELPSLLNKPSSQKELAQRFSAFQKRNFCVYIAANETMMRSLAFDCIHKRRNIVSPGRSKNNAPAIDAVTNQESRSRPDWQQPKIDFMKNFRFALVFENSSHPGYTTEKIVDAMVAGCIPIYWGNPDIQLDFNSSSFFDLTSQIEGGESKLVSWVKLGKGKINRKIVHMAQKLAINKAIDGFFNMERNTDELFKMFSEPWVAEKPLKNWLDFSRYENRLIEIIES